METRKSKPHICDNFELEEVLEALKSGPFRRGRVSGTSGRTQRKLGAVLHTPLSPIRPLPKRRMSLLQTRFIKGQIGFCGGWKGVRGDRT